MIVLLDSGVLGLLVNPIQDVSEVETNEIYKCTEGLYSLLSRAVYVVASEISDYEVRRELIRIKSEGVRLLDNLRDVIEFRPLTKEVMQKAAEFWAEARQSHIPTAEAQNIDADMIISAQWSLLSQEYPGRTVLIATTNIRHLRIFAEEKAMEWKNITI